MDKPTASRTSVLRVINERAVYEQIRLNGPVSRPEVAKATGLSKPTISLALVDLVRGRLVRTVALRAGGGRPGPPALQVVALRRERPRHRLPPRSGHATLTHHTPGAL